jgi:beta-glucanase (GH16 family)
MVDMKRLFAFPKDATLKKRWHLLLLIVLMFLTACNTATPPPPTETPMPTATNTPAPTSTPVPTATPSADIEGWDLVWQDEFDGTEIDLTKWTYDIGGNGWGNGEFQYYTDFPENAFIEDGQLVIQALNERYKGKAYTSARLKTQDLFAHTYGRYEARIQIPFGQGIWPAFWMLGDDIATKGWPHNGEIDIMENIGREPNMVHGTVHGPGYAGGEGIGRPYALPSTERFADEFHVFAIEWEVNEIRWYVDGIEYNKLTAGQVPGDWVYDHPFFMVMNVAVGGVWPGYPDETTTFPQQMRVDYVRVYDKVE